MRLANALMLASGLLLAGAARAEPAVRSVQASSEKAEIGQPITVTVEITDPGPAPWSAEALPPESPFSLIKAATPPGATPGRVAVELGLFALGPHPLPPISLSDGRGHRLVATPTATVTGESTLKAGDTTLRSLAGPQVPLVFAWKMALLLGLLAIVMLIALGLGLRALWRWRLSPEARDRRLLRRLIDSGCSDLEFYEALDGLVRRHLERRHGIPAPERTSTELIAALGAVPGVPSVELESLLREADLVKFAARPAHPEQRAADSEVAVQLLAPARHTPRGSHVRPALS